MPISDDEEREIRVNQMLVNIEKMRFDMATEQRKLVWESRKFMISAIVAAAALVAAGVAAGNYFTKQQTPIVIQLPAPTK